MLKVLILFKNLWLYLLIQANKGFVNFRIFEHLKETRWQKAGLHILLNASQKWIGNILLVFEFLGKLSY